MGKPRMIILIRHAQSEGNLNRDVHQIVPDHRVKLTSEGRRQAEEAGRKLRDMLRPDDTIRIFTSPYRRTRETTEGILKTLTEADDSGEGPSPFSRSAIKVYEEPRLREQDFGNFQPCSTEMERMWQERADYGHFFYRIPNGESAADAYDRCSGFNESLWRAFGEDDFPSVCVLVTHGLMTRVFLMKWYHWSVEYFEDLRNVNHCEFIIMKQQENGKFALQNTLRTWSEVKRRATLPSKDKLSKTTLAQQVQSPIIQQPQRIWGGCVDGCNHDHSQFPRRTRMAKEGKSHDDGAQSPGDTAHGGAIFSEQPPMSPTRTAGSTNSFASHGGSSIKLASRTRPKQLSFQSASSHLRGRDAGGSESGLPTPTEEDFSDTNDSHASPNTSTFDAADADHDDDSPDTELEVRVLHKPRRRPTVQDLEEWKEQSGMGRGTRADALGDPESDGSDGSDEDDGESEQAIETPKETAALNALKKEEEVDKSIRGSVY